MKASKNLYRAAGVIALAALANASTASAAVLVDLDLVGAGSTVTVGQTIVARIAVSTDNPNGIAGLNVRITTSTASLGGAAAAAPFLAAAVPATGASGTSAVLTSFNPALNFPGETSTTAPHTTTFVADGENFVPSSTNNNRPLSGFTGQGTDGRGPAAFFSPSNSVFTQFADVTFKALREGTVFFSLSPNGPTASEYTSSDLSNTTAATATVGAVQGAGFSVQIVAVPEPATLGFAAVGALGLLARRRAVR